LAETLPHAEIFYVADSGHAPYGSKSPAFVRARAEYITRFLLAQGATAIVVACNTATAMAIEHLRARFDAPIIAMEPAVKPAVAATRSGVVAVLATAGTLESERYRTLLHAHGSQVTVLGRVCHDWVGLVEHAELDTSASRASVAREVLPLLEAGADTLVLGCTHFPFLAAAISAVAGPQVSLIDPAPAVARELKRRLPGQPVAGEPPLTLRIWSSRDASGESARIAKLWGAPVTVRPLP
jgi:glutamate racemase